MSFSTNDPNDINKNTESYDEAGHTCLLDAHLTNGNQENKACDTTADCVSDTTGQIKPCGKILANGSTKAHTWKRRHLNMLVKSAVLTAVGVIFMYLNFPIFPGFSFLKMDLSPIPTLIGGFMFGPVCAIVIETVKILFTLLKTYSVGIGELSNFICSLAFILPPTIIYRLRRKKSFAVIGLSIGIVIEALVSTISGYFFIFPMYVAVFGPGVLAGLPLVVVIFSIVLPFNLIKTAVASIVVVAIYRPLKILFTKFSF